MVEVGDTQIALQFQNGNFKQVLRPGRYAIWKDVVEFEHRLIDLTEVEVPEDIERKLLLFPTILIYIKLHEVPAYTEGLLYVDGKLVKRLPPGTYYFWKNDKAVRVETADLRQQLMEIAGQEILTKDKAAVRVNFFCAIQKSSMWTRH